VIRYPSLSPIAAVADQRRVAGGGRRVALTPGAFGQGRRLGCVANTSAHAGSESGGGRSEHGSTSGPARIAP
jgi:hypothetical protein